MRNNNNTNDILDAIKGHVDRIRKNVAQAIKDVDVPTLARYGGIGLIALLAVIALGVGVLALVGKILGTLLGKVLAVPLVLFVLGLSYKLNLEDSRAAHRAKCESATMGEWAENIYEYVRDAMFLVFRAVSEYTNIVTPSRPSAIELVDTPYTLEDGYAVFNFVVKVCGPVDVVNLKNDLMRTIQQMHRAHELNGIPRDLTEINGGYYCPLQILGKPQDFGEYIQVSVVFATEQTVKVALLRRSLNLDNIGRAHGPQGKNLTDDDL